MIFTNQHDLLYSFKLALCRARFYRVFWQFFEDFSVVFAWFFRQCSPLQIKYISFACRKSDTFFCWKTPNICSCSLWHILMCLWGECKHVPYCILSKHWVQYRTVQNSTVQYSTGQYTVQFSSVQYTRGDLVHVGGVVVGVGDEGVVGLLAVQQILGEENPSPGLRVDPDHQGLLTYNIAIKLNTNLRLVYKKMYFDIYFFRIKMDTFLDIKYGILIVKNHHFMLNITITFYLATFFINYDK